MHKRHRSFVRLTMWVLIALLPGCAKGAAPPVGVKPITANLTFGIPNPEPEVGPPNGGPIEVPILNLGGSIFKPLLHNRPVQQDENSICPDADTKVVRKGANNFVSAFQDAKGVDHGLPPVGDYLWKVSGTARTGSTGPFLSLPQFSQRSIKDVHVTTRDGKKNPIDWTYVTEETALTDPTTTIKTTWELITSRIVSSNPLDPNSTQDSGLNGLFLVDQVRTTAGKTPIEFSPQPHVLFMPLPADNNRGFGGETAYVDSSHSSDETWTLRGWVTGTVGYDACGEFIDSRFVNASLTIVNGPNTSVRDLNFGIATQYGGVLVAEHGQAECTPTDTATAQSDGVVCPSPQDSKTVIFYDANIGAVPAG
ncbi:MAG: hypothetical protein ABR507_11955 [Actinomycetota bacterium]